tara:strand:+ start:442 stop:633 length:192 start_codon:yes stop_codon:yes gene_type:complete
MANTINWGELYCSTWFGNTASTTDAIPLASAPACWAEDVLALKVDTTSIISDSTLISADRTII